MNPVLGSLLALAGIVAGLMPRSAPLPAEILILRDVTVIDATGAPPAPHMVVVVENGRIQAVRPLLGFRPPPGSRIVEGEGRYLIPGLWDMHVHMSARSVDPRATGSSAYQSNSRYYLPLFVSWGITGVRDMSGRLGLLRAWRDSVNHGSLIGPRMVITGFKLGAGQAAVPGAPYPVRTEDDVRQTVRLLQRHGADFVKIDELPAALFPALVDESRKLGIPFVGHVTTGMSVAEASRMGQRTIEHLDGVMLSVSSRERRIRTRIRWQDQWWMQLAYRVRIASLDKQRLEVQREINQSVDRIRADSLFAMLIRYDTWQVPTLAGLRDAQNVKEREPFAEERTPYLPPLRSPSRPGYLAADLTVGRGAFTRQLEIVGAMYRAGVPLLAGTDTPGTERVPGFSLAEELDLMVRAGLTPMAALQSATREPARFLGQEDSLGTIEPGKVADLVLLDGDPLSDIRNIHQVYAVVLRGRYLSPDSLATMRASVRQFVQSLR